VELPAYFCDSVGNSDKCIQDIRNGLDHQQIKRTKLKVAIQDKGNVLDPQQIKRTKVKFAIQDKELDHQQIKRTNFIKFANQDIWNGLTKLRFAIQDKGNILDPQQIKRTKLKVARIRH